MMSMCGESCLGCVDLAFELKSSKAGRLDMSIFWQVEHKGSS